MSGGVRRRWRCADALDWRNSAGQGWAPEFRGADLVPDVMAKESVSRSSFPRLEGRGESTGRKSSLQAVAAKTGEDCGATPIPVRVTSRVRPPTHLYKFTTDGVKQTSGRSSVLQGDLVRELPVGKIKPMELRASRLSKKRSKTFQTGKGICVGEVSKLSGLPNNERQRYQEMRSAVILAKRDKLLKTYGTDCEIFAIVAKQLIAQDSSIEKRVELAVKKSLRLIGERHLGELKQTIAKWNTAPQ
ncbi:uncharacterized protein [Narcine bancroftii]|uniref:uncharacterized protein isoform X2 n=1 Tax=Narcine bancroftii TaxID=1343680 RepID=UPI003831BFEB